jgi:tetratricopeptide (TPR) repeat protein
MITQLARQAPSSLGVIARTTAMKYKGSKQSVREIGRDLGVDYVVEGSVRRVGRQLRVTAQLIETRNQSHLWAQSYDRQFAGLLELEKELGQMIARQVTVAVAPAVTSSGTASAAAKSPANAEAYDAYLKARYYHGQASVRSVNQAVDFYRQAIEKDPNYALAHAGLARAYIFATRIRPRDALFQASASAQKAVELNSALPEARLALAMTKLYNDRDFSGAEREFQRAVEIDPGNAEVHFYYAHFLAAMGRAEDSIAAAQRAQALDPFSPLIGHYIGRLYHFARRYDEAIHEYQKTIELDPNYAWAHFFLALSYERQGKFEDGLRERQKYWSLVGVKSDEINGLAEEYKWGFRADEMRKWTSSFEGIVLREG